MRHHPLLNTSSTVKLSHVWTKHLVPAKTVKVYIESFYVNGTVGCPSDTINDEDGPRDSMDGVGDLLDRVNSSHDVGDVVTGHDAGLGGEERLECFERKTRVVAGGWHPPLDGDSKIGC